jgi:hypothetical protein
MPRGAESNAIQNTATGQQGYNTLNNQAQQDQAPITQFFKSELNNPQGFSPQDIGAMLTSSNQSLGGSQAGAVGQGNLLAARTGNQAGFGTALDQSARQNAATASNNALNVQLKNANLKQQQQQAGAGGLEKLYGTNLEGALKSLGLSNEAIQQWISGANATNGAIGQNFKIAEQLASMGAGGVAGGTGGGGIGGAAAGIQQG